MHAKITYYSALIFTTVTVVALVFFVMLVERTYASDAFTQPCHTIDYASGLSPQFSSFGSPSNLFDGTQQLLMQILCNDKKEAKAMLGTGDPGLLIYMYGYEIINGKYHQVQFTGSRSTGGWLIGNAEALLSGTGNGSVVAYMCKQVGVTWKCGCRDRACTRPYWQRQDFVAGKSVLKDSVLRSSDRGLSFDSHFNIITDIEPDDLGPVNVNNISFHPKSKNTMVVSAQEIGLFFHKSNMNLWTPIPYPPEKVYSFLIDKKSPDSRAFASGKIDNNGRVFRTDTWGGTWRTVYAEPGDRTLVTAITQDPRDNDLILAGTSGGTVVRSEDRGDTWLNIGQSIKSQIEMFAHDATKKSFVYLLMRGGKIYHSKDAGLKWLNWEDEKANQIKELKAEASALSRSGDKEGAAELTKQVAELVAKNDEQKAPSGIISIATDPNDSGVIYAGLSKGLYRSKDYGKYWERVNIIESAELFPIRSIEVSPKDSDEIVFVAGSAFYRSTNFGKTWSVTPLNTDRVATFVAYDPFDTKIIYVGLGK